jgi:hypothetical protein
MQTPRPRRFAPLDPAKRVDGDTRPMLKGVVFDVDGTLCEFFSFRPCLEEIRMPLVCVCRLSYRHRYLIGYIFRISTTYIPILSNPHILLNGKKKKKS